MTGPRYRAQVWNGERWVDGILSTNRRTADSDAVRLARRYGRPTRVIEEEADLGRRYLDAVTRERDLTDADQDAISDLLRRNP
jgi:hypothetical protein